MRCFVRLCLGNVAGIGGRLIMRSTPSGFHSGIQRTRLPNCQITDSIAAVTVPEYVTSCPRFAIGLIPETTRSIFSALKSFKSQGNTV